jgi:hypothetical protein
LFLVVLVILVGCCRAPLGHALPISFQSHQIPYRFPGVPLAISFGFHQIWWFLMVLVVLVVFVCFGGFGGFW